MPALAALTINDGLATPVAHTFGPYRIDEKQVVTWFDRISGVGIGFNRLTFSIRAPNGGISAGSSSDAKTRVYKAVLTIDVPKLESTSAATGTGIAPAPTVAYVHAVRLEFLLPERGALADRKDLIAYVKNALSNASVNTALETLENFY